MFPGVLDERLRQEQADLNACFIELLTLVYRSVRPEPPSVLGLPGELARRLGRMRHRKRGEIAACPYALYTLHLADTRFWCAVRLRHVPPDYPRAPVPAECTLARDLGSFILTALLHARHLAVTNEYAARLSLGIPPGAARTLRDVPVSAIPRVAALAPGLLAVRLRSHRRFWPDLIRCVDVGTRQQCFAAKSLGLQLLAAAGATVRDPRQEVGSAPV